ncbi:hypothetical protein H310_10716 [Aphanomyces invadans]|uniref:Dipeptidase n=1 Tax=Aphanomyces invadans TaxID=157072 RepID=A0A024TPZ1_9STRA|nr:hypothetical protein H310_10716 [Aphanomyces invadans]ETV96074.1 hypothetical protein H310_10716 [Aphanomyces invadans]|eukprot:XP_008875385.1 hypothetical protein H310_10716 [Aphanomyces invadans]
MHVAALLAATFSLFEAVDGCTVIGVTHKASADGSSLLAHTDDAGGGAADIRLIRVPAADHAPGSKRAVYNLFGGYPRLTTQDRGPLYRPVENQTLSTPLGYIPQVPHTYAYFDQDYGMMNEVQLSIAESTCTAKTVGWAKDVPFGFNLFGIAELTKVALERCDSARCAVQTMGDLAVEYGFFSEDSGDPASPGYMDSAEALAISDKYGEMWVFHVLTGPKNSSAVWAAQRVPDGHVTAIANAFVIREMNLSDTANFLASSNVVSFAQEMGWHSPDEVFDFTKAYAWDDLSMFAGRILPLYAGRRLWRIFDTFAPSLQLDPRIGFQVNFTTYPFSIPVDSPVALPHLMRLLGDHYEGTPFDMTRGLGAGAFHAPIRYDGPAKNVSGGWERPIAMYRTMFSFVLQIQTPSEQWPDHLGGTAWYAQDSPHGSVFVPFSCAQSSVPASYVTGNQSVFNTGSAWWAFNFVNQWSMLRWNVVNGQDVRSHMNETQTRAIAAHASWLRAKLNATAVEAAANALASDVVASWWTLAWSLVGKYSGGYITTGEAPSQMKVPGYSKEWLEMSEFNGWPGKTYTDPMAPYRYPQQNDKGTKSNAVEILGFMVLGALLAIGTHYLVQTHRRDGYRSYA